MIAMMLAMLAAIVPASASEITATGQTGRLAGTLVMPDRQPPRAVVLILPGSGPTDRDGNSRLGVRAAPYRLLADALGGQGIASVRIDKRGLAGSAGAGSGNSVTLSAYAADTAAWIAATRAATGAPCVWLIGHSEGGLVALASAKADGVCGLVLVAAAGRPLGQVIRAQLRANPANAPLLAEAEAALGQLEAGQHVDTSGMAPALLPLFRAEVQDYLIDLLAHDPAVMIAAVRRPVLIVQGLADLQVGEGDARRLAAADSSARLVLLPGVNHVLKPAPADDRAANFATYGDPALPLALGVVDTVARFVLGGGK